jgi:HSP20 family protein
MKKRRTGHASNESKEVAMDFARLNPWNWFKKEDEQEKVLPKREEAKGGETFARSPLTALHSEIDRIFDTALNRFGLSTGPAGPFKPKVDIAGSEREYTVTAEIPGVDEKDIVVELKGDSLIIRAEKRQEERTEDKGYYRVERSYGSYQRILAVPKDVDTDAVRAKYDSGVLTVTLPRKAIAPEPRGKRINIG